MAALFAITASLTTMSIGAVITAAPASACTHDDDVNVLCSNEQAFVDALAAADITPTKTPRIMVNQGQSLCGQLGSGVPRDVVVQKVYGGAAMRLDQAQAIVAAAIKNLCFFSSAPGPNGTTNPTGAPSPGAGGAGQGPLFTWPLPSNSPSSRAGQELGGQSGLNAGNATEIDAQELCAARVAAVFSDRALIKYGPDTALPWSGGSIRIGDFDRDEYIGSCMWVILKTR